MAHTANAIPILVCGELAPPGLGQHEGRTVARVDSLEHALASTRPADVAVVGAESMVADGWLDELRAVAYTDARVATVSALMAGSRPGMVGLPPGTPLDEAATAIRTGSPPTYPRLERPYGACVYVRRSGLELIGAFGDWDRFSALCLRGGLSHLLAEAVLIEVEDDPSLVASPEPSIALRRSVAAARRHLNGVSLLFDLRNLASQTGGTRLHALELLGALERTGELRIRALVSDEREVAGLSVSEELGGTEVISVAALQEAARPADLVHRAYQIGTPADLGVLGALGERLVITHQDLIGYQNPFYFGSRDRWEGYRAITRRALAAADRVIFPSAHAYAEAIAEELLEPERASVVRHGVNHIAVPPGRQSSAPPTGAERIPAEAEVMLCLGTDYWHKNRLFALRLVERLRRHHGWRGWLVLAGAHMRYGSSAPEEAELLATVPELAEAVLDLGEVDEGEKQWLFSRSDLVVYPTTYEGFGLVPFEAADHGLPCLWAKGTALSEVLPDSAAGIEPWDVATSAEHALALLSDARARERNLDAIRQAGRALLWERTAGQLVEIYAATCDQPPAAGAVHERQDGGLMGLGVSEDALRLVGPGGALPRELERPLLAVATRPRLSRCLFGALKFGYDASARWRRRSDTR
jgi:glycosyltransferase involved in cell wall biosynthesis